MKKKFRNWLALSVTSLVVLTSQSQGEFLEDDNCCSPYSYNLQFRALWLQPICSNLDYAVGARADSVASPEWTIHDIDPDYHFGFDVGLGLVCHQNERDIRLNWVHFTSKDSASHIVEDPSEEMIGPFFEIGPDAAIFKEAAGFAKFHFDAVNLDFGFYSIDRHCLITNFYVGVGYARIKQVLHSRFSDLTDTVKRQITTPSTFCGAGPQIGVDFAYPIWGCLDFTGEAQGTLLVGELKNHTSFLAVAPILPIAGADNPNFQNTNVHNRTSLVPALEGRLGLTYAFSICGCYECVLGVGYEAKVYFNAIQSVVVNSEVDTPPLVPDIVGVFARTFHRKVDNFALAGPYVSLDVAF